MSRSRKRNPQVTCQSLTYSMVGPAPLRNADAILTRKPQITIANSFRESAGPWHFGHAVASTRPLPSHLGQTPAPVLGGPGNASSPASRLSSACCIRLPAAFFLSEMGFAVPSLPPFRSPSPAAYLLGLSRFGTGCFVLTCEFALSRAPAKSLFSFDN